MYVCICKGVTLKTVRETISQGASTVDEIESRCRAGGDCGSCRDQIACLIDEHHDQRRPAASLAMPALAAAAS